MFIGPVSEKSAGILVTQYLYEAKEQGTYQRWGND